MKPKKLPKKLGLNKKTISNLTNKEMKDAYGGYYTWWDTCGSLSYPCCLIP